MKYQHNKSIVITKANYEYVREYKRQLLQNITHLLNDLNIKFVIAHGNLIEFERGQPIYHDDDIDIRFSIYDIEKWAQYCRDPKRQINKKYNLLFERKFTDANFSAQMYNGILFRLIHFNNTNIPVFPKMTIVADLVCSSVLYHAWQDYIIDFNQLREIEYLGVKTFAPSEIDTKKVLTLEYGENYLVPLFDYEI